jgi:hypothetical protein
MQAQYGTRQTGKRLATLKKYKKEPQDSFSTLTQTEHLAVLLSHTELAYSIVGLAMDVYAADFTGLVQSFSINFVYYLL